jgi:hypothetical protein
LVLGGMGWCTHGPTQVIPKLTLQPKQSVALLPTVWKVLCSVWGQLGVEREKATAGPKDSTFSGAWRHGSHLGHFTAASSYLLSLSCSLFLVKETHLWGSCHSPGISTPAFVCFWPCLALALRPFSACCTAMGFLEFLSQPSSLLHGMYTAWVSGVDWE